MSAAETEAPTSVDPKPIRAQLVHVDPQLAMKLLRRNEHNRALTSSLVKQYANDIRAGNWVVNGEAIKISAAGRVLDGQHRLEAVLEADAPMQTLLITGLPDEAQETMDQGKTRTFADVLKLRGEKYCSGLAGATRMVFAYERDRIPFVVGGSGNPSVPQLSRTLERNPDLRVSVRLAYELMRRPWIPVTTIAGLHYLLVTADPDNAEDFFKRLAIKEHAESDERRIGATVKAAFIVLAWNAYLDGAPLERLRWNPGGSNPDPFPIIRGMA